MTNINGWKDLKPFDMWVQSNIPTVFGNEMTYYEKLCRITQIVNEIISDVNLLHNDYITLESLFSQLQLFVKNYFENLNVQEEINNKLDNMAETGELQAILTPLLGQQIYVKTAISMKTMDFLTEGTFVKTSGFYQQDSGGSEYFISAVNVPGSIELNNGLYANINPDKPINILGLGAAQNTDISSYIETYLNMQSYYQKQLQLYIPRGFYYCSNVIFSGNLGCDIYGDFIFDNYSNYIRGTVISSVQGESNIWSLGTNNTPFSGFKIKGITFTSADNNNGVYTTPKNINACIKMVYAEYGIMDEIFFTHIKGEAINMSSSWEITFGKIYIRCINNKQTGVITCDPIDDSLSTSPNLTTLLFEYITAEKFTGNLFYFKNNCKFFNNHFGCINVENAPYVTEGEVYSKYTGQVPQVEFALFYLENNGSMGQCCIDSLELNNITNFVYTFNSVVYMLDTIIKHGSKAEAGSIITSVVINGMLGTLYLIKTDSSFSGNNVSTPIFGNIIKEGSGNIRFDIKNYQKLIFNGNLRNFNSPVYPPMNDAIDYTININRNMIYSDENSESKSKCVLKGNDQTDYAVIYFVDTGKVILRAKIDDGKNVRVYLPSGASSGKQFDLSGTGEYKIYELDYSSLGAPSYGKGALLISRVGTTGNIYIDRFINI